MGFRVGPCIHPSDTETELCGGTKKRTEDEPKAVVAELRAPTEEELELWNASDLTNSPDEVHIQQIRVIGNLTERIRSMGEPWWWNQDERVEDMKSLAALVHALGLANEFEAGFENATGTFDISLWHGYGEGAFPYFRHVLHEEHGLPLWQARQIATIMDTGIDPYHGMSESEIINRGARRSAVDFAISPVTNPKKVILSIGGVSGAALLLAKFFPGTAPASWGLTLTRWISALSLGTSTGTYGYYEYVVRDVTDPDQRTQLREAQGSAKFGVYASAIGLSATLLPEGEAIIPLNEELPSTQPNLLPARSGLASLFEKANQAAEQGANALVPLDLEGGLVLAGDGVSVGGNLNAPGIPLLQMSRLLDPLRPVPDTEPPIPSVPPTAPKPLSDLPRLRLRPRPESIVVEVKRSPDINKIVPESSPLVKQRVEWAFSGSTVPSPYRLPNAPIYLRVDFQSRRGAAVDLIHHTVRVGQLYAQNVSGLRRAGLSWREILNLRKSFRLNVAHEIYHLAQRAWEMLQLPDLSEEARHNYQYAASVFKIAAHWGKERAKELQALPSSATRARRLTRIARGIHEEVQAYRDLGTRGVTLQEACWRSISEWIDRSRGEIKDSLPGLIEEFGLDQISNGEAAIGFADWWYSMTPEQWLEITGETGFSLGS